MAKYQIQDLGDGQGLDILDDGDLLAASRDSQEVLDFLYDHEISDDGDQTVTVLAGALGREADQELTVSALVNEFERGDHA